MNPSRKKLRNEPGHATLSVIDILTRMSDRCRVAESISDVLSEVAELLRILSPYDAATCFLYDQQKDRLVETWTVGRRVDVLDFLSMGQGLGISGWTAQYNRPILFSDRSANANFDPEIDFPTVLSLPLMGTGHTLGAVNLAYNRSRAVDETELPTLAAVANLTASYVELRWYREQWKESQTKQAQLSKELLTNKRQQSPLLSPEVNNLLIVQNHRINDPLSVIVGNVQCLLEEQSVLNQKGISRLRRIEEAALRIGEVIRDPLRRNKQEPDKIIG